MSKKREDDTTEPTQADFYAAAFGIPEDEAEFLAALEAGETDGDLIVVPDPDEAQSEKAPASAQRALDSAERLKTIEAVKQALASIDRGEGRPMDEVFDDLETSLGSHAEP